MIMVFAPLLGACLIAGSLTIDEFHNYYDVLAGLAIRTTTAFASFRMVFAAIFDFRFNHIQLPRTQSLLSVPAFSSPRALIIADPGFCIWK